MTVYSFAYVVGDVDHTADDFEDIFFDAGCDDATLALMHGSVAVCFDRESASYRDAVFSAYEDILLTGARIKRFEPDYLVSAAEISKRSGLSRAAISLFENGERGADYPEPYARITTPSPLWDWVDVSRWLCLRGNIDESEFRSAQISRVINFTVQGNEGIDLAKRKVDAAMAEPLLAA